MSNSQYRRGHRAKSSKSSKQIGLPDEQQILKILFNFPPRPVSIRNIGIPGFNKKQINRVLYAMMKSGMVQRSEQNPPQWSLMEKGRSIYQSNIEESNPTSKLARLNRNLPSTSNQGPPPPPDFPPNDKTVKKELHPHKFSRTATLASTNPIRNSRESLHANKSYDKRNNILASTSRHITQVSPAKRLTNSMLAEIHKTKKIKEYDLVSKFKRYSPENIHNALLEMEKNGLIIKSNIFSSPAWLMSSRGNNKINNSKELAFLPEGDTELLIPLVSDIKLGKDDVKCCPQIANHSFHHVEHHSGHLEMYSSHSSINDTSNLASNSGQVTLIDQNHEQCVHDQHLDFSDDVYPTNFYESTQYTPPENLHLNKVKLENQDKIDIEFVVNSPATTIPVEMNSVQIKNQDSYNLVNSILNRILETAFSKITEDNITETSMDIAEHIQEQTNADVKIEDNILLNSSKNPVSVINEYAQHNKLGIEFVYKSDGPPHNRNFKATVIIGKKEYPPMYGSSKKEAKINVSQNTLLILTGTGGFDPNRENKVQEMEQGMPVINSPPPTLPDSYKTYAGNKNAVSVINEYAQANHIAIEYDCVSSGSDHNQRFHTTLTLGGKQFPPITGMNKKDSKLKAAENAVDVMKIVSSFVQGSSTYQQEHSNHMKAQSYHDRVANMVNQKFDELLSNLPDTIVGRKILAGFVMSQSEMSECGEETKWKVVSIGSGNRCVAGDKLSMEGDTVNDCHAEVIARRGLLRFFYQQIAMLNFNKEESIFTKSPSSDRYSLRPGIAFHLYISTAPCGDGALFAHSDTRGREGDPDENVHTPIFDNKKQGILRTKVENGEGCIPIEDDANVPTWDGVLRGERLRTMSCSDKIARWNFVGLQGALLSQYIEPIYMSSLTLGMLYNHGHLTRAICCRVAKVIEGSIGKIEIPINYKVNHPQVAKISGDDPTRDTGKVKTREFSINWCSGDEKAEVMDGTTGRCEARFGSVNKVSRVSKRELFKSFCNLNPEEYQSYVAAKKLATNHQMAVLAMKKAFEMSGGGQWMTKPSEVDDFS